VRRILNLAARKWRDEHGLTWLETAPLISMLKVRDGRAPYPLSWAEQRLLLPELPEHLAEVCLFLLNSGLRSKSEAVRLDWRWEIAVPELDCSVFLVPGDNRKNEEDHVCVLNSVARSIIERCRGKHPTAVFTFRGKPLRSVNNTAWLNARERAVAKYEERFAEPAPEVSHAARARFAAHGRAPSTCGGCVARDAAGNPRPQERQHHHPLLGGGVTRARRCDGVHRHRQRPRVARADVAQTKGGLRCAVSG